MARYGLLIDVTKCTGCYNCFLACRDEYSGNDYPGYSAAQPVDAPQNWMQIKDVERGTYPKPKLDYVPMPCQQCADAPCMEPALDGAVYRRPDGIVMIDPEKAKGQTQIAKACPYRVIFWNKDLQTPQKCTMCAHLLDAGWKEPRCVEACPTGALTFGDLSDPNSEIVAAAAGAKTEDYHPEYGTKPVVKYIGIPKRLVVGEVLLTDQRDVCPEGVIVTLEGNGVKQVTHTDCFGDFEFDGLAKDATFTLRMERAGYKSEVREVNTCYDVDLGRIDLHPVSEPMYLDGGGQA
jgi:Fe-S-cluster-containing dehydrogenase component